MPSSAKAKDPRGVEINFDEATHRYWTILADRVPALSSAVVRRGDAPYPSFAAADGSGGGDATVEARATVRYVSVTTFLNHFFPPFDADGRIAEACARKRGISADALRFEWRQNAAAACEFGTRVHETAEDAFHGRAPRNQPRDGRETAVFAHARNVAATVMRDFSVLGVEQIVFDLQSQLAGSIDLLAQSKNDGSIWILDHKTNKRIDFHSRYGTHGNYPIEHLEDCSATHYALQLSAYEFILRFARYIPASQPVRRGIFHYAESGVTFHELPDLSKEVREMALLMALEPPF